MKVNKPEQVKKVPPFQPTKEQRKWLEEEKKETGNSFSTILKGLLQKEVNKKSKGKK